MRVTMRVRKKAAVFHLINSKETAADKVLCSALTETPDLSQTPYLSFCKH